MLLSYYPEMKEAKPAGQIEASMSHYGKHWYCCTPLTLAGRGIRHLETMTASTLVPGSRKVGWNKYKVTDAAFEKLCVQYDVVIENLL